ncbi:hypothetical protein FPSE_10360 [Fusarium pseudograminearum CS3096]|uniref:Uncharacterized protein n=1 Tax=Fusarium pseudograminearum (strain CS3096) TaxID=1028729 RepID=K3VXT5_FUSPC|nr:hypothetical protein FPSE_10360 [Fusarium pseudograminearum CS3096]EKJ69460.1 hypothetical protein FPSE_10360 [Fusarium pseudograminearum CS3096]
MDSFYEQEIQDYPESIPSLPVVRSAEMPMLWDEEHQRLIDSCVKSKSLYEMYLQLPVLAAALEDNQTLKDNNFSVAHTVNALNRADWSMLELLHSMDHDVVQSIVKNTFAYDMIQGNIRCFPMPRRASDVIPGVYVIGLSIDGQNGRFLNIKEMETVVEEMKEYVAGYKAHIKYQSAPTSLSRDEAHARRHINHVDGFAGGAMKKDDPAFIKKEEEMPSIEALIKTFEKMCDRSIDSTGLIRMHQSPLYVGCSKHLFSRTSVYGHESVRHINKPLGLTISILRKLGHRVQLTIGNVVRVWKADQLPKAEQLVTTLAGSLVYQHGFNATEAGGTGYGTITDEEGLRTNTAYLISGVKIITSNLRDSLQEIGLRQRYIEDMNRIHVQIVKSKEWLHDCNKLLESLPPNFQWGEQITELEAVADEHKRILEDLKEARKFWNLILQIQNIVYEETGRGLPPPYEYES